MSLCSIFGGFLIRVDQWAGCDWLVVTHPKKKVFQFAQTTHPWPYRLTAYNYNRNSGVAVQLQLHIMYAIDPNSTISTLPYPTHSC
jgi:hypothetical protein